MLARLLRPAGPVGYCHVRFASNLNLAARSADLTELEKQSIITETQAQLAKSNVVIKKLKPTSPGIRWWRKPIHPYLWKGKPFKPLTLTRVSQSGRNHSGRIVVRHRGGGVQRRIRLVDYDRRASGPHIVERIEYDPNRTAHIALIYKKGNPLNKSYIVACEGLRQGDEVESFRAGIPERFIKEMGGKIDPALLAVKVSRKGNCLPISMIPVGTTVHNVGERKDGPAKYCRAAGTYGRIVSKIPDKNKAIVKLQSGEERYISLEACATLGVTSNAAHRQEKLGKAGRNRLKGIRPTVRGVAMNTCDHPLGGGRGKSKGNKPSMSPWGVLAKGGFKTRTGKHVNKQKFKDRPRGAAAKRR
ncbi:mitochondrial 54S ribosomal protein [Martiniozyma asiatica (nom. inval.)]|nr:mitochondrial 54S ribosomal protein [Martiniozyma asiatica]